MRVAWSVLATADMSRARRSDKPAAPVGPVESARAAGLRYMSDTSAGIRREMGTLGWVFRAPDGTPITDEETLTRGRKLAMTA